MALQPTPIIEQSMLVVFSDLSGFARIVANRLSASELLRLMNSYFELLGTIVEPAGGQLIKCLGDAALLVFPATDCDLAMQALQQLLSDGDAWLAAQGLDSRQQINVHLGMIARGQVGTLSQKWDDIYGQAVNRAALLPRRAGINITTALFEALSSTARQGFQQQADPEIWHYHVP